ncbi:hypothetical protein QF037_009627 [Streptomyces canus]|nr:hypothetical protein [Streptomyces canus]
MWTGIGLFVAGAVGLVVGGLLDVDAADPWANVAGGTAGLLGLALTVYALLGPAPAAAVTARGTRSVAAGGGIGSVAAGGGIGSAATGGGARAAAPSTMPPSPARPAPGPVTASASGRCRRV